MWIRPRLDGTTSLGVDIVSGNNDSDIVSIVSIPFMCFENGGSTDAACCLPSTADASALVYNYRR